MLEVALHRAAHLGQVTPCVAQQPVDVAAQIADPGSDASAQLGEVLLRRLERLGDALKPTIVFSRACARADCRAWSMCRCH
jgi:hypothetical protein